jgi:hypothetical protein
MNLTDKLTAKQIVYSIGMSGRPEYFSGRGAITSDLNYDILQKIYKKIEENLGKGASKNFVRMVRDIPKLSATDFLCTLYMLEGNNWKWDKKLLGNQNGIYIDGNTDEEKQVSGMMGVIGVLSHQNERDETHYIRDQFLFEHGIKPKKKYDPRGFVREYY